ncbi:hypothetical protein [Bosea sp. TND4EK4]|uniref:hypothetical protein n=1 Tax=Bosea sp. TND4EK4 TaxID=1907408 RepID=UPI0009711A77|nr:hypothetical protein [Bosea sp. TND4EK4]
MTEHDPQRPITPHDGDAHDRRIGPIRDPLASISEAIGDDPTIAELVALRASAPDLKEAARDAKRCADEGTRVQLGGPHPHIVCNASVALKLAGLSCAALVAIWPSDSLQEAEAKLALAEHGGPYGADTDRDTAAMLEPDTAIRIRHKRAAFDPGSLMLQPGPVAPTSGDRGLATWPLKRFDLVDLTPQSGGEVLLSSRQIARWGAFLTAEPDFEKLEARVETMITTADRLKALARQTIEDATHLRRASEAALILAYLAAAQIAIWPAFKGSTGAAVKQRLVKIINDRASRNDPLPMQATIRHLYSEAIWPAKQWRYGVTIELEPDWLPIV